MTGQGGGREGKERERYRGEEGTRMIRVRGERESKGERLKAKTQEAREGGESRARVDVVVVLAVDWCMAGRGEAR